MTDMFLEKFRALVPKYLEDEWQEEDGLPEEDLDKALAEHQFTVPLVLREFYLALGGCEDLMEAYHYFWDPEELEVDDEGFLMFLEQSGVLSPEQRELVLDRVMALGAAEIDLIDIKWVVLMVMFNQPGQEAAFAWLESDLLEGDRERIH